MHVKTLAEISVFRTFPFMTTIMRAYKLCNLRNKNANASPYCKIYCVSVLFVLGLKHSLVSASV